ncbi:MAG: sigma-54-dependent Fis family transcriptional regulator [Acidobacteria bacterium]|nr:sigma-54-dependent Fis family transcriptional regulator [Acidobacteriota bacterium]
MPVARNGRTVLLGEDDVEVRSYLETALRCQGYSVEVAENGEEVLACLQNLETPVSAVVMDVVMPRRDGIDALKEIRRSHADLPVIMISGSSSPLNVVDAMKNGATDFIAKPIGPEDLRKALTAVLGAAPEPAPAPAATEPAAMPLTKQVFFGTAPKIRELQNLINQIGWSEAPVLIQGETGSGKEVYARELHARSPRAKRPVLKLNCAALPSELVESELFGYERGAFTGAFQKKLGMFELADGGTIMLDEIGDMDIKLQAKLLQVLQDHEFQRLGGKDCVHVDVRVIAATHRDLEKAIAEGNFREDLYYRLNVVNVQVPPLRERKEDIIPMAEFLARKHTPAGGPPIQFPASLQAVMLECPWPGNIRQLENMVRKYIIIRDAGLIEQELRSKLLATAPQQSAVAEKPTAPPPAPVAVPGPTVNGIHVVNGSNGLHAGVPAGTADDTPVLVQVAQAKREAERSAILTALKTTNWNRRQAAVLLKSDYKGLLYKMKVLDIKKEKTTPGPAKSRAAAAVAAGD